MEVVVDTSAVLAVLLEEPSRPAVLAATGGCELVAPESLTWEVGNALGALFKRRAIDLGSAVRVVTTYLSLPIVTRPTSLELAVRLAHQLNVYAYDAYMIACAQTYNLPLVTLDRGLIAAATKAGVALLEVKP